MKTLQALAQGLISVATRGQGLYEVTTEVSQWLAKQGVQAGLLTLFVRHTSASPLVQENAAPDVRADLNEFFRRLVPEDLSLYRHDEEGGRRYAGPYTERADADLALGSLRRRQAIARYLAGRVPVRASPSATP